MGEIRIKDGVAYETDVWGNENRIGEVEHNWLTGKDYVDRDHFQPFEPDITLEPEASLFPDIHERSGRVGNQEGTFKPYNTAGGYQHHRFEKKPDEPAKRKDYRSGSDVSRISGASYSSGASGARYKTRDATLDKKEEKYGIGSFILDGLTVAAGAILLVGLISAIGSSEKK